MTGFLSPVHVALLLVVLLVLFGAKRLPELGNSLGSGLRGFRDSLDGRDAQTQAESVVDAHASPRPAVPALQPASPPAAQSSAAQPVRITSAADEPRLPPAA
jgi:sec-independent protein translocase protein TatA